ncbi:MAG: tRNA (adenosine(37)-N6)-threonylcarbamoyltransferase complex ATPase subunit type 1 TsaE [bacterium]
MEIKFNINQIDEIVEKYLMPALNKYKIFAFYGPLGTGKTTLIKSFLRHCGVTDNITSPTFNYVNTYKNKQGQVFNHFDLYRINSIDDFIATGFDEFLNNPNEFNLIEWPSVIENLLESNDLKNKVFNVVLKHLPGNGRERFLEIQ